MNNKKDKETRNNFKKNKIKKKITSLLIINMKKQRKQKYRKNKLINIHIYICQIILKYSPKNQIKKKNKENNYKL